MMKIAMIGILCLSLVLSSEVRAEEGHPAEAATDCQSLEEKIHIFLDLNAKMSADYARVSDPSLCVATLQQCEHFYNEVAETQKEFRESCDKDYAVVKVSRCESVDNVCPRAQTKKPFADLHSAIKEPAKGFTYEEPIVYFGVLED